MAQHSSIPQQVIEILLEDCNKDISQYKTYDNFEELQAFNVQIVGETNAATDAATLKFKLGDHEYLGENFPLTELKGDTSFGIGKRGFVFEDFKDDIPHPKAKGSEMVWRIDADKDARPFVKVRILVYYKGKNA